MVLALGIGLHMGMALAPTLPPPPDDISQGDEIHAAAYSLVWEAPASCPSAAQIEARIAALRNSEPGGEGVVELRARVTAHGDAYRLVLTTEFRGRSETRELASHQCGELGEAVALVASFALAPEPVPPPGVAPVPLPAARSLVVTPPAESTATTPTRAAPEALAPPSVPPRRRLRARGLVRVGAMFEGGLVSGVTGGPVTALGIAWPRWHAEVYGAYLGPRRDVRDGSGARYQAGVVGARGCRRMRAGPIEIPLCIGAEGGVVRAATIGIEPSRVRHGAWAGPLVGGAIAWRRHRAGVEPGLWVGADVVARARGTAFTFDGDERFRQALVSARLSAGFEIFFP